MSLWTKRIFGFMCIAALAVVIFTLYANFKVAAVTKNRIYADVESVPYNRVGLLLGTNPLNRYGNPNSYFINRINTAAELYRAGRVDFIIASGDNHTRQYDEPTAMRDSLMAHGVPEERIILDFAGFRTLDSVVRAKEVFGCDSLTIISQEDHNARALYLAETNGIEAVAVSAPLKAGRWVRIRLALREWLARDKMMLDIWFGKRPHFLGEKIGIPDIPKQKSYSTADGMIMKIINLSDFEERKDSIVVEFTNVRSVEALTGEWFEIEKFADGVWTEIPFSITRENGEIVVFNMVAYVVSPGSTVRLTVRPWFYDQNWPAGSYRLKKTFIYPPYPVHNCDTAYVEFQIR